jgi:hypothetical protein
MTQNAAEVFVGKGLNIYLAPSGTALPTNLAAPSASFVDLGYTSTDGVQMNFEATTEGITAHQSLEEIRRIKTAQAFTFSFNCMQWNDETMALAFGGGDWTNVGGMWKYSPPEVDDDISEYALVADIEDGDINLRVTCARCVVDGSVETGITNAAAATMPITLRALKPTAGGDAFNFISDDVQFS